MIREGDVIPNGWFWDGEQNVYHDGTGNFYIGEQWYARPDLLAAQPYVPPAMTWQDKARVEKQRLMTPWPKYREAWRHAKAEKWPCRRYAMFGYPVSFFGMAVSFSQIDQTGNFFRWFFIAMAFIVAYPLAFWRVYYRHIKTVDSHKAFAFLTASLGLASLGLKAANHHGMPSPQQYVSEQQRFAEQAEYWRR